MYLLIDECCSKALVSIAHRLGHTAQRTREVAALGEAAEDRTIFDFASEYGAVLVTINRTDYVALAAYGPPHPGVIILPSVAGRALARLFRRVLPVAERVIESRENMFVEINARGAITSFRLP